MRGSRLKVGAFAASGLAVVGNQVSALQLPNPIRNIARSRRRTMMVLRKDTCCGEGCGCPCRGRCTLAKVDEYLEWAARWAGAGIRPDTDFDRPWTEGHNAQRMKPFLQHQGRNVRFILLQFRGDWDQYSSGFGFPRSNQKSCCFLCPCLGRHMYDAEQPPEYTHDDYDRLIKQCTIDVLLSRGDVERAHSALGWDFRKDKGMHGRVIQSAVIVFDYRHQRFQTLLRNDRLELGGSCQDVHCTAASIITGTFPYRLLFWRRSPQVAN